MAEQSHEAGALFEFDLDQRSDAAIWIKHRGTGHIYQFALSDDRSRLRDEHTIVPNPSSRIEPAMFATPARRAALRYMATPVAASEDDRQLSEGRSAPVTFASDTTGAQISGDDGTVDLDERASAEWGLFPETPEDGVVYGRTTGVFESVRNAARFRMEDLPSHQQKAVHIRTDSGRSYGFGEIVRIYQSLEGE